jgi:hypothetical protein
MLWDAFRIPQSDMTDLETRDCRCRLPTGNTNTRRLFLCSPSELEETCKMGYQKPRGMVLSLALSPT